MVTRQTYDFSDYTELIIDSTDSFTFLAAQDPALTNSSSGTGRTTVVYSTTINAAITELTDFSVYARLKETGATISGGTGVYISDGTSYVKGGIRSLGDDVVLIGYAGSRLSSALSGLDTTNLTITSGEWYWIKMQYVSNTNTWYVSYNNTNSYC